MIAAWARLGILQIAAAATSGLLTCAFATDSNPSWTFSTISMGEVRSGGVTVGANQSIRQIGGSHLIFGNLNVVGGYGRHAAGPYPGHYALNDGLLYSYGVRVGYGIFSQTGGTNQVAGTFSIGAWQQQTCFLSGGLLVASNLVVGPGLKSQIFQHEGGRLVATNLQLYADARYPASYSAYWFSAGELTVENLFVGYRTSFSRSGGTLRQTGILLLAGGAFAPGEGTQSLGRLGLKQTAQTSNSFIALPFRSCTLRFQASGDEQWDADAVLRIGSWAGLPGGNGEHRIIFGDDANGITYEQLAQIRFVNPRGYPHGEYPAVMLESGEVVAHVDAATPPWISYDYYGYDSRELQLTWRPGYILQAATTSGGPFQDIATNSSLILQVNADEPARFFRLRQ